MWWLSTVWLHVLLLATSHAAFDAASLATLTNASGLSAIPPSQWSITNASTISLIPAISLTAVTPEDVRLLVQAMGNISETCAILTSCCVGFTGEQVKALPDESFAVLSAVCVRQLSVDAIHALTPSKFVGLSSRGVGRWTTEQLGALQAPVLACLTPAQAVALVGVSEDRRSSFCRTVATPATFVHFTADQMSILLYLVRSCRPMLSPEALKFALVKICSHCMFAFTADDCTAVEQHNAGGGRLQPQGGGANCKDATSPTVPINTDPSVIALVRGSAPPAVTVARWEPQVVDGSAGHRSSVSAANVGGAGSAVMALLLVVLVGFVAYAGYVQRLRNRHSLLTPVSSDGPSWGGLSRRVKATTRKSRGRHGSSDAVTPGTTVAGYGSLQDQELP